MPAYSGVITYFGNGSNLWDTTALQQLAYNLNCGTTRSNYQLSQTTPPTAITQATAGTWSTLASYTLPANGLPGFFTMLASLNRSAVVSNWVRIGLFRNGVLQNSYVFDLAPVVIEMSAQSTSGGGTDTWDVKWMITNAAVVTYSMPAGFRIAHYQI